MTGDGALVHVVTGRAEAVPDGDEWLTLAELTVARGLAVAKRLSDWRLGRWVAKKAISEAVGKDVRPGTIQILAAPDGAPRAELLGVANAPDLSLSISHSEGVGFAVAATQGVRLGCDVERITPRSDRFVADYFTADERNSIDRTPIAFRATATNLVWSAKESALKFLREGTRLDTRSVAVLMPSDLAIDRTDRDHPATLTIGIPEPPELLCCWWVESGFVWTVAGRAPFELAPARSLLI